MQDLITFGSSVKALGEGKVGGHLVLYGSPETPDLSAHKDFFTASTEYDIEAGDKRGLYWCHGQDPKIGIKKIGTLTVTPDDLGLWVEGVLNMADEYQRSIYELAEKGKLGFSSGAPSHLVARKAIEAKGGTVHEITHWPIAEGSLTPTPADYRNVTYTIKSLAPLIGLSEPDAENHTTKALPGGMSYSDLMAFLSDELNEDLGGGRPPYDSGYLYICDLYDDAVIYRDGEDLYRVPFTVTAGNDAQWGTPEPVVRTTVYAAVTEGDDPAMKSHADVTAIKQALTRSMTFGDHADVATSAMEGFVTRAEKAIGMDIKAGRVISAANRDKLRSIHAGMQVAHDAMAAHMGKMGELLAATDPDAKKEIEDFAALRGRFLRVQSDLLHLTG